MLIINKKMVILYVCLYVFVNFVVYHLATSSIKPQNVRSMYESYSSLVYVTP